MMTANSMALVSEEIHPVRDVDRTHEKTTVARRGSIKTRMVKVAAVGAVALTLLGAMCDSANANRRSWAVGAANNNVSYCFYNGGDPYVYEFPGSFNIVCLFPDGGSWDQDLFYYE